MKHKCITSHYIINLPTQHSMYVCMYVCMYVYLSAHNKRTCKNGQKDITVIKQLTTRKIVT